MPGLRIYDDGATVTVDLHGAGVEQAARIARRIVAEAAKRGRTAVRLIHGSSTSSELYRNRSIKHELYALLESDAFAGQVTGNWKAEDTLVLSLPVGAAPDRRPIRPNDVSD